MGLNKEQCKPLPQCINWGIIFYGVNASLGITGEIWGGVALDGVAPYDL